jgi:hypothetical protein
MIVRVFPPSPYIAKCTKLDRLARLVYLATAASLVLYQAEKEVAAATVRVPAGQPSIQRAIDAANDGDEVLVAPGTYFENINFNGKAITLISEAGPSVTIIDGGHLADVVGFGNGEGPTSVLAGFTIRNGFSQVGAGVYAIGASPTIISNIFERNISESGGFGAAIAGFSASPIVEGNIFRFNSGDDQALSGVVSFVNASSPFIANNIFFSNDCRAVNLTLSSETPSVLNNTFVGNSGGIRVNGGSPIYKNNILVGNQIGVDFARAIIGEYPGWTHNLVFANGVDYQGIDNQTGKNHNISADPLFECPEKMNFRLLQDSPCIDTGDNEVTNIVVQDFGGTPRSLDGDHDGQPIVDIGAFEFSHLTPALTIEIQVDHTAAFNPRTGVAVVRGTVLTTRATNIQLSGTLLQGTGHARVGSGTSSLTVDDSGTGRWELVVRVPDQKFRGGPAIIWVVADAVEASGCQATRAQSSSNVGLRPLVH